MASQRSILDADLFLRQVLKACVNKPLILVDRGPWYPQALKDHGLRWRHTTFGLRNAVERWFRTEHLRIERGASTTTSKPRGDSSRSNYSSGSSSFGTTG
ncbi:MAG: hypothetical protein QXO94_03905 [Candidatus Bathyarchaeia archaeon]